MPNKEDIRLRRDELAKRVDAIKKIISDQQSELSDTQKRLEAYDFVLADLPPVVKTFTLQSQANEDVEESIVGLVLACINDLRKEVARDEVAGMVGKTEDQVARALGKLVARGRIKRIGSKKYAKYVAINERAA